MTLKKDVIIWLKMKIKKQYLILAAITLIVVIIASFGGKSEDYDRYKHDFRYTKDLTYF